MDDEENWERTARAYTLLTLSEGEHAVCAAAAIRGSYLRGISDEFISPVVLMNGDVPVASIKNGDTVIFFNHRADGMRQLVRSIAVPDLSSVKPALAGVCCMVEYDRTFALPAAFPSAPAGTGLAAALDDAGVRNYRITDATRRAHLTSVLNRSEHAELACEIAEILPAADITSPSTGPEMASFKITDRLLRKVEADPTGVFFVNLPAVAAAAGERNRAEAAGFVDTCLGGIVDKFRAVNGSVIISTAAEGGDASTLVLVSGDDAENASLREIGTLADIAPTILSLAGVPVPAEMTGRELRN